MQLYSPKRTCPMTIDMKKTGTGKRIRYKRHDFNTIPIAFDLSLCWKMCKING